ncbi:tetratricopeptide repeat protein [Massilia sp.]|uniref:tetratricopeptide repeat protein n=1 Tax=Massilia sp. TaxID=1882437 RepID=UPI0028A232FB|nr:tetratricopeptide repeat protein [Massilia sp.]
MKYAIKRAISLGLLCAALASCAPIAQRVDDAPDAQADATYRAGRVHHLAQRQDLARSAYLEALRIAPRHLDARNGLAALHVERRELTQAIAIWRELTASLSMASGPSSAYLFSNLGRAHILNGEPEAATAALEKACLLDPLNYRTWQLLGETLRRNGQEARAEQMLRQAATLRQHDLRADIAATGSTTGVAALGQALQTPQAAPPDQQGWARTYVHVSADGMMELRRTTAREEAPAVPVAVASSVAPEGVALLEIRNGNGIAGMARAVSRSIDEPGLQVARLSNEPGFAVDQTRIEYEPGRHAAARRLARRLGSAELRAVPHGGPTDLRLVLGRDLAGQAAPLRPAAHPLKAG